MANQNGNRGLPYRNSRKQADQNKIAFIAFCPWGARIHSYYTLKINTLAWLKLHNTTNPYTTLKPITSFHQETAQNYVSIS